MKRLATIFMAILLLTSSLASCGTPADTSASIDAVETDAPDTAARETQGEDTSAGAESTPTPSETEAPAKPSETEAPAKPIIPDDREDFCISVDDDTYVLNADANGDTSQNSYHGEDRMHAKSSTTGTLRRFSYVRFDVSELYEAGVFGSIELSLTLAFRQKNANDPENIKVNVYACEDWGDKQLTYAKQPARYGFISTVENITTKDETYYFPITDYVRQVMESGGTTIALMIEEATPESPLHVQFYTKEASMEKAPKLNVSYKKVDDGSYEKAETEALPDGLDVILAGDTKVDTYTVVAIEDSYVSGGETDMPDAANTALGSSAILDFKANYSGKTQQHRIVYLKFDLGSYKASDFDRATLRLYCKSEQSPEGADIKVFACYPEDWSDKTLTYNNRPENEKLVTTQKAARKGFVSIDITDYVVECLKKGEKIISLCLEGDTALPRRMTFNSIESGNEPPCIILTDGSANFNARLDYSGVNPWSYAMKLVNEWISRREVIKSQVGAKQAEQIKPIASEYSLTVGAASYTETDGYNTKYTNYATRTVDTLSGYKYNVGEPELYDEYGGYTGGERFEATGYFYTKFIDGRWWNIDPLGYPFFRTAVVGISRGSSNQAAKALAKHGTVEAWAQSASDRLWELGFNSTGGWSDLANLSAVDKPLAQTKILYFMDDYAGAVGALGRESGSTEFLGNVMPVFDPDFVDFCDSHASRQITAYADNPYIYGWMSDNELRLVSKSLDNYLNCDTSNHVFAYSYATAWTYMYMMTGKANVSAADVTDELRNDFLAMIFDRYFNVVEAAVRKYDPNHMYLGCRFIGENYYNEQVMKVAGYYCDVISFNYYKQWTPEFDFISNVQKWTDTPFIVTEWYAKGMDAWEKDNRLTNTSGSGWTVKTQEERGIFYQNFALGLLESKYCVGFDWFQYLDNDPDNLNADPSNRNANKGIYSNDWEEYTDLTEQMQFLNQNVYTLIKFFDER